MQSKWASAAEEFQRLGLEARVNEPVSLHTSMGVGGAADIWISVRSLEEISAAVRHAAAKGLPWRVMGWGTNVLVSDAGLEGLVVDTREMRGIEVEGGRLWVNAGEPTGSLVSTCLTLGLVGPEVLSGVPGTVGGAVAGNAGGKYGAISEFVDRAIVVRENGNVEEVARDQLNFFYRGCDFGGGILGTLEFRLPEGDRRALERRSREILDEKTAAQPLGSRSAGCIFRNPPGADPAGMLIDKAGLKGKRVGAAEVSAMHANFIVNRGGATYSDVARLIDMVRNVVREKFGVELELEVKVWGRGT